MPTLHAFKDVRGFANLQLCVDFFFVLSGFVISHAYRHRIARPGGRSKFLSARLRRLWPLHAAVLGTFVGIELLKFAFAQVHPGFKIDAEPFSEGHSPLEILTNLAFLQSFGLHPGLSWNGPSWSIAVEFWTSVVFMFVAVMTPRLRVWSSLAIALASAAVLAAASPETLFVSYDWGLFRCLLGFFAGCLAYDLRAGVAAPRLPFGVAEVLCIEIVVALMLYLPASQQFATPIVFAVLIYVFSFERGVVSRVLVTPVPQMLGLWSFSIYMTHMLTFQMARTLGSYAAQRFGIDAVVFHNGDKLLAVGTGVAGFVAAVAVAVPVTTLVGALCWRYVETPLAAPAARKPAAPRRTLAGAVSRFSTPVRS